MENYRILSVTDDDLDACVQTIRSAFKDNAEKYGFTKENYPSGGAFITLDDLKKAKEKGVHMYAAWLGDKIVGYVQLEKKDAKTYSFQKFAVLPECQQLGVGKMLIAFCKNKAKVHGASEVVLLMVYDNKKLLSFYEANGFELITTKRDDSHPFLQGIMRMKTE